MRTTGNYFVKVHQMSNWTIAFYYSDTNRWSLFGSGVHYQDSFFYQIDENRIINRR